MTLTNLLVCTLLGFTCTVILGHASPTTTPAPSAVDLLLLEFRGINQKLDSIQHAIQSSYSVVSGGSGMELIASKLLTLETKFQAAQDKLEAVDTALQASLVAVETQLQSTQILFKSRVESGSTFVRWGRKTCTNSSQVVYTGVAGGSIYSHTGAAANLLCLPLTPWSDGTPVPSSYTYIYGSEYQHIPAHHDHDVPCSVCRAAESTTIMVPATQTCPMGWMPQYSGHLVAGHYSHPAATEFNCLDANPENSFQGHENKDGRLLFYVITACGSLPCPPYVNGQVVSCVVCSK